MGLFKILRLFYLVGFIKALFFAALVAISPWAIAYVMLPESMQDWSNWYYLGSFAVAALLFSREPFKEKRELDEVAKPTQEIFESFKNMSSADPELRKKAAQTLMKNIAQLERDDQDEDCSIPASEMPALRRKNIAQALELLRAIRETCHQHGIETDSDSTLEEIAQNYAHGEISVKDALSALLPHFCVGIWTEMEEDGTHEDILRTLISATKQDIDISDFSFSRDDDADVCRLEFVHQDKKIQWRFRETEAQLSENFLNHALKYVADVANGRFLFVDGEDSMLRYVFVPAAIQSDIVSLNRNLASRGGA